MSTEIEVLAMYLPQFHRCKQNDLWWGDGFTEWTLVKKTKPLFDGHNQPRVPSMGYYDLGDATFINDQFKLAQQYGVTGFNIYLYWSTGNKLLESVTDSLLKNKSINTRFCLTWANHPWTRTWSNRKGSKELLFPQKYEKTKKEIEMYADYLSTFFNDDRYIKINTKPIFFVYKPEDITNIDFYINYLREILSKKYQIEIHIVAFVNNQKNDYEYLNNFDSVALSNPTATLFSNPTIFEYKIQSLSPRHIYNNFQSPLIKNIASAFADLYPKKHKIHDYQKFWDKLILQYQSSYKFQDLDIHPMAMVDFDNTPRYGKRARIFNNVDPAIFQSGVEELLSMIKSHDSNILLVNAWNEWGEGMHLEPDSNRGLAFLNALKTAKLNSHSEY